MGRAPFVARASASSPGTRSSKDLALAENERRRSLYLGDAPPICVVIIVDDGIATGATMKAALRGVRGNGPSRLILAAPVAPRSSIDELAAECDDIVRLEAPEPFFAVGLHYVDFSQTTDDEVAELLAKERQRRRRRVESAIRHLALDLQPVEIVEELSAP